MWWQQRCSELVIIRVMGMLLAALAVTLVLGALGEWLSLPKL